MIDVIGIVNDAGRGSVLVGWLIIAFALVGGGLVVDAIRNWLNDRRTALETDEAGELLTKIPPRWGK